MDIFLPFHPIACFEHPYSYLNSYAEPCNGALGLKIADIIPWTRASQYQGLAYSIFYYPIYKLLPFWQSGVLFALIWMALFIYAFCRLAGVSAKIAIVVFGINFLWVYNNLQDISPVAMQNAFVFVIPLLVRAIVQTRSWLKGIAYNLLLALVTFFAFEYKFIFSYYFSVAIILAPVFCWGLRKNAFALAIAMIWRTLPAVMLTLAALYLLLTATTPEGKMYFQDVTIRTGTHGWLGTLVHFKNMTGLFLFNFISSFKVSYSPIPQFWYLTQAPANYSQIWLTYPFWAIFAWVHIYFYKQLKGQSHRYKIYIPALWIAALLSMLLISSNQWTRHSFHLIPGISCLLGSMALCMDYLYRHGQFPIKKVILLLALSQLVICFAVTQQPRLIEYSKDRMPALERTYQQDIADKGFIVHWDWGTYYISALYGSKNQVSAYIPWYHAMWAKNLPQNLEELKNKARKNGRYLVFVKAVGKANTWIKIEDTLYMQRLYPADPNVLSEWEVWAEPGLTAVAPAKMQWPQYRPQP